MNQVHDDSSLTLTGSLFQISSINKAQSLLHERLGFCSIGRSYAFCKNGFAFVCSTPTWYL